MTNRCRGCGGELHGNDAYCTCGQHYHEDCLEGHRDWCAREGTDRWIGALEF